MKKIFTFLLVSMATLVASATDYNEPIVVTVNGEASEQTGMIVVTQNGDKYDLALKNFMLNSPDGPMGIGNVELKGIKSVAAGDAVLLFTNQTVTITDGDDPNVSFWMAQMLPPVPVEMQGKLENNHLRCFLDIDLTEAMGQVIQVAVGGGYQLRNQGFEEWHTSAGNYVEPNGWHSFESATGSLATMAGHHIVKSDDAHSGAASARIYATSIFGIVANGTMTTGRMNAGSMSASNTSNNAYLDMSKTDVDGNGDPFYMPLYSRPDSIAVWVKFKQGKATPQHPYATISAVITDGSYYQDPEDKEYSNVVAKASNKTIAETEDQWVRVSAPFVYQQNNIEPKTILVTLSTNADPGSGSANDELFVDDIELVYNNRLASLTIKGESVPQFSSDQLTYETKTSTELTADDIDAVADGLAAHIVKTVEQADNGYVCTVKVYSGDMAQATTYVVNVASSATAISEVSASTRQADAIYNLNGQRLTKAQKGIFIVGGRKYVAPLR